MSHEDELRAELARTRSELLALLAVGQALRASRDLSTVYRVVASQLSSVIQLDSLFIAIYEPERNLVRFVYGLDEGVVDERVTDRPLAESRLNARVVQARHCISIADLDLDPLRASGTLLPFGQVEKRSRSWLGAPMLSGDQVQGVLAIQSYRPGVFTDADADLLMLLASQIGVAVENARLFEKLRRTIAELSSPMIPVAEGVLVLPLVGTIDADRANRIIEQALEALVAWQVDTLLIDVTGVSSFDAFVVDSIMKLIRAASLLGTRSCIVGVSAEMARLVASLGLELSGASVFGNLKDALAEML